MGNSNNSKLSGNSEGFLADRLKDFKNKILHSSEHSDNMTSRKIKNSSPMNLGKPVFLMDLPFSYSTDNPDNAWMKEMDDEKREINRSKAMNQFYRLYNFLASEGIVYLLPSRQGLELQDLVFTANLGFVPEHIRDNKTVILSNFCIKPREGESEFAEDFFQSMGYDIHKSPHKFEGEAELKHLHDNIYIGGYGIRSEREAYEWMEKKFDMEIIKVKEKDEYLYHLDGSVFPLTRDETLVYTEVFDQDELDDIEKHTNIIEITKEEAYRGICNSIRFNNYILNASNIHDLEKGSEKYQKELRKNRKLKDICAEHALKVKHFNISEYLKAGSMLSCMVMHLNRRSYDFRTT